jgi:hypothetical protein
MTLRHQRVGLILLIVGGLIQAVVVAFALQIGAPPPRRRNLHLMLLAVPMRESD